MTSDWIHQNIVLNFFLNRHLGKKSYYFNFGSRKERIILARLRLKCGSLKDHLFKKNNIIDAGLCTCGKIETTAQYLLQCPIYIFIRNETIQTMGTIDVQSLIFASSLKNENENRLVFETVSKHVARTKRFDWNINVEIIEQTAHELYILGCRPRG